MKSWRVGVLRDKVARMRVVSDETNCWIIEE